MSHPRRLGHFELLRPIARGGMGEVWEARDVTLGRSVALKFITDEEREAPERRALFEREARAAAALQHPNIATVHELAEVELGGKSRLMMVMELVEGIDLHDRPGLWRERELIDLGLQITDALAAAHQRGIVHRDLKPANIRLTATGKVKILDFGISRLLGASVEEAPTLEQSPSGAATQTLRGARDAEPLVAGTVGYMAPEQALGQPVDQRSDLFALGAVLFRLATASCPFAADSWQAYVEEIQRGEARGLRHHRPDLSTDFEQLVANLLRRDPERRIQTARETQLELAKLASRGAAGMRRNGGWRRLRVGFLLATLPLAIFLAILFGTGPESPVRPVRVAVLTFDNLTGLPESEYFCRGLSTFLAGQLSGLPQIEVLSRGYTETQILASTVPQFAQRHDIDRIVEGSVQLEDAGLLVTVSLTDAASGSTLHAGTFPGPADDALGLQRSIAAVVAGWIAGQLSEVDRRHLELGPAHSATAFDLLLRGQQLLEEADSWTSAAAAFRQAIEMDPESSLAWSGLAKSLIGTFYGERDLALLAEIETAARRALELDPGLIEASLTLARVLQESGRAAEAIRLLQQTAMRSGSSEDIDAELILSHRARGEPEAAQELLTAALRRRRAGAVHLYLAQGYERLGELDEAEREFELAIEADAAEWRYRNDYGVFLLAARYDFVGARRQLRLARRLAPSEGEAVANLAASFLYENQPRRALEVLESFEGAIVLSDLASNYGTTLFHLDRMSEAISYYTLALRLQPRRPVFHGNLADAYARLGQTEAAHESYRAAAELLADEIRAVPMLPHLRIEQALYLAKLGDCGSALGLDGRAWEHAQRSTENLELLAFTYGLCGVRDKTLQSVRRLLEGGHPPDILRDAPELAAFRGDPDFERLFVR